MLDQTTKAIAVFSLPCDIIFPLFEWFSFQLSFNVSTFIAIYDDPFELGVIGESIYPVLYLIVVFLMGWTITKIMLNVFKYHDYKSSYIIWLKACMALILSGAIGNGIDKFLRGSVVDFIRLEGLSSIQPIFNVADLSVWIGEVFILVFFILAFLDNFRHKKLIKSC